MVQTCISKHHTLGLQCTLKMSPKVKLESLKSFLNSGRTGVINSLGSQ